MMLSVLTACGGSNSTELVKTTEPVLKPPITEGDWYRPNVFSTWQLQLQGKINTNYSVEIHIIDLFDVSKREIAAIKASGKHVICYFSGGTYEKWRSDAKKFLPEQLGNNLTDWNGERWLNINAPGVYKIMLARLDTAKEKGCEGVDIDNVDGYINHSGFKLSERDQLKYNSNLANAAHKRLLSVGLKNDLDQIKRLEPYYDFIVTEQCFSLSECDPLELFIAANKPVFNVEYHSKYVKDSNARHQMCSDSINRKFSSLVLPLELDDSFHFSCL